MGGSSDYSVGNPDFSFVQFRANLLLRWEHIPGSDIFLVWSPSATGFADLTATLIEGLDDQIAQQQLENIFLNKATHRFIL